MGDDGPSQARGRSDFARNPPLLRTVSWLLLLLVRHPLSTAIGVGGGGPSYEVVSLSSAAGRDGRRLGNLAGVRGRRTRRRLQLACI